MLAKLEELLQQRRLRAVAQLMVAVAHRLLHVIHVLQRLQPLQSSVLEAREVVLIRQKHLLVPALRGGGDEEVLALLHQVGHLELVRHGEQNVDVLIAHSFASAVDGAEHAEEIRQLHVFELHLLHCSLSEVAVEQSVEVAAAPRKNSLVHEDVLSLDDQRSIGHWRFIFGGGEVEVDVRFEDRRVKYLDVHVDFHHIILQVRRELLPIACAAKADLVFRAGENEHFIVVNVLFFGSVALNVDGNVGLAEPEHRLAIRVAADGNRRYIISTVILFLRQIDLPWEASDGHWGITDANWADSIENTLVHLQGDHLF